MPVAATAELADGSRSELEKTLRSPANSDELHAAWVGPVGQWVLAMPSGFSRPPLLTMCCIQKRAGHFLTFLISDAAAQAAAVSLRAADRAAAPRLPSGPVFHGSVCKQVSRSARCEESVDMEFAKLL